MRRFFLLLLTVLAVFITGCGQLDQLNQIGEVSDALTGGDDVGDDIEHVVTVEDEEATVSTYTTGLGIDEAEETFVAHMEDEGYEIVDQEKELGYFAEFGDAGYGGVLMKNESNYMYIHLSEGADTVTIARVIAPQEAYETHYEDEDGSNGTNDEPLTLPESDASGEDLEIMPRYEGAVRTEYAEVTEGDEREVLVTYVAEATLDDVKTFYLDEVETSSMSLDVEGREGDEYYISASDGTHEVDIVILEESDTFVEITIHLVETV